MGAGLLLGELDCGGDGGSGGDADEQAVAAREGSAGAVGDLGVHVDVGVGESGIVDLRHDGGGHVLEPLEAVEGGVGLHGDAADGGVELAQAAGGAHEGSGGSEAGDEVGDLAVGLVPDLVGGGAVVGAPV